MVNAFTNRPSSKPFSEQEARETGKKYKISDEYFEEHIVNRHGSNSSVKDKSRFKENFDIKKAIHDTLNSKNSKVSPNTKNRPGYIFEKDFGYPIGKTSNGKIVSKLKVIIDESGRVISAYPIK